ncbi:macrolide 2'-phosphotransferase [Ruania suaedae]|uniref:macrolide 2'-phosphotransferase n=1 Tax=Ruania suaedae TaxID=2897774 RepID=UPI001E2D3DD1|nr:macrolide 2'-phosphotransferase [Ruania suaedae]
MSETPRSPLALAALATVAIPGLDVVATRPPRSPGADFDVVGVLDASRRRWIVRAPRRASAGAALEAEVALLAQLATAVDGAALSFDVPRPAGFAPLPEGGRAMVYPQLRGAPLEVSRLRPGPGLAAQVARAIASLHELDPSIVGEAGLPVYDAETYRRRRLAEVDEAARTGYVPAGLLRRWEHALENVTLWRFRATPVHGDLAAEHVLVAEDEVTAILDWSDARVADPADDLAWLLASAPEDALDSILEAYSLARTERGDDHLADRAVLAGELALVRWLMYGVRTRAGQVIDEAIEMLRQLDEDVADTPPIGHVEPVLSEPDPQQYEDEILEWNSDGEDVEGSDTDPGDETGETGEEASPTDTDESEGTDDAHPTGSHRVGSLVGDDNETGDLSELRSLRRADHEGQEQRPRRGDDETPTVQLPPLT